MNKDLLLALSLGLGIFVAACSFDPRHKEGDDSSGAATTAGEGETEDVTPTSDAIVDRFSALNLELDAELTSKLQYGAKLRGTVTSSEYDEVTGSGFFEVSDTEFTALNADGEPAEDWRGQTAYVGCLGEACVQFPVLDVEVEIPLSSQSIVYSGKGDALSLFQNSTGIQGISPPDTCPQLNNTPSSSYPELCRQACVMRPGVTPASCQCSVAPCTPPPPPPKPPQPPCNPPNVVGADGACNAPSGCQALNCEANCEVCVDNGAEAGTERFVCQATNPRTYKDATGQCGQYRFCAEPTDDQCAVSTGFPNHPFDFSCCKAPQRCTVLGSSSQVGGRFTTCCPASPPACPGGQVSIGMEFPVNACPTNKCACPSGTSMISGTCSPPTNTETSTYTATATATNSNTSTSTYTSTSTNTSTSTYSSTNTGTATATGSSTSTSTGP